MSSYGTDSYAFFISINADEGRTIGNKSIMKAFFKSVLVAAATFISIFGLSSCKSSRSYLVIPHSVSSASAVTVENLNLSKDDYNVLNSITETASVLYENQGNQIKISDNNGEFSYIFKFTPTGWVLSSFKGAASLGYFSSDLISQINEVPNAEEFARRAAIARIIRAAKDYQADGIVEPMIISSADNVGKNKIEYTSTVSAKLISINVTH